MQKKKKLCVHDIVKDYSKGFPVPNQEWSFFFYFFQMIRKEKNKYFLDLKKKYLENKKIANITKKNYLELDREMNLFFKKKNQKVRCSQRLFL